MRRLFPALAFLLASLSAGQASAQPVTEESFTERAVVSCLTGATVSGVTTAYVTMPLAQSGGAATAVAASAVVASAGLGCGFGVVWAATATGYSWAWRSLVTAPAEPEQRPLRQSPADQQAKELIHAELP